MQLHKANTERRFNAPSVDDVAIVVVSDERHCNRRDIILEQRSAKFVRILDTHRSYDALQYPILFPKGEDGYQLGIKQTNPCTGVLTTKNVSSQDFYAHRIMVRKQTGNHVLKCRQLLSQYVVDMYAKVESERLLYIRLNQKQLRVDNYIHLRDALSEGNNAANMGQLTILPSSFTGGPRYMMEKTQDAMTYVRKFGKPDFFITFTCNPNWQEIKQELFKGQAAIDRHDVVARVFKLKLQRMIDLITKDSIFGKTRCYMYSVEWQKRGLPHAHILVWLCNRIHLSQIDDVVSAELPDKENDPKLFEIITRQMVHGPCGNLNRNSPCMKDGRCSKNFPKPFSKVKRKEF